jgi:tRNA nucleotidyltransferase (CCA-adding enzyme)
MKIYEVGGAVRDSLLNKDAKDKDWVVVGSSPEEMIAKGFKPIGKDFPVFLHPESNEEYALARTERKTGKGYHGFNFYYGKEVTLEEDLSRRDLTINAIARDSDGKIIDPFNGLNDIKNKIFRHVSDAFSEDPLRAIRLARFHTYEHLKDFKIDSITIKLIKAIVDSGEIANLSADRVWVETELAIKSKIPNKFFEIILELNLKEPFFKSLEDSKCDSSSSNIIRWAELQANNNFLLGDVLPIPNIYKNASNVFEMLLKIDADMTSKELINLVPSINFDRNEDLIKGLATLPQLTETSNLILNLLKNSKETDFSVLKDIPNNEINEEKLKIYLNIINKSL